VLDGLQRYISPVSISAASFGGILMYSARPMLLRCLVAIFALFSMLQMVQPARAEVYVNGTIKVLRTGWNADAFGLEINAPQQNPAGCPNNVGYISDSNQPGYKTFYAAAIAAYQTGKPISVVIDSNTGACIGGWPKIIGINLLR
jgi:hypothetical protein